MKGYFSWSVGVWLLLAAGPAWSQSTAQMNGTVADSSGGVLPGATVVAIQTDTGFRREVVTDSSGSYSLLNLPLGPYRLEVTLPGFQTYAQRGIVLQVNSNPVIAVTLRIGSLEETVSVEASAPLVETRSPAIGGIVDNEQVEALPLEGRNPISLVVLSGAAASAGEPSSRSMTTSGRIAITGGQPWGVAYVLDGAMHNNVLDGLNLPLPFPDALQEFRVETSSQNSERGRQGSGTVSVVTKDQRPNQVLDDPYGDRTLENWFDPAAFEQPALGTHGNAGRNAYVGPGSRVVDLSLVRAFPFRGTQRIEARIEAFNAFNRFRWSDPIANVSNANFGRILSARDPPIMQFALKYQF